LDAYTAYVPADGGVPSREHDYLYVAAGEAGLHIFDMTDPDQVVELAPVTDLGGAILDVDVTSELAPPGVDDYAVVANAIDGLQVVDVTNPHDPVNLGTVTGSVAARRVLVEVQQLDRMLDEQGNQLKENSHPFTGVLTRADIVRILSTSIDCQEDCAADIDGNGQVDVDDLIAILLAWGTEDAAVDIDGDDVVDVDDLSVLIIFWGACP
jgi:hypothetical protein